jgi:hypothetical protein
MNTDDLVLSQRAEDAIALLFRTLAAHRANMAGLKAHDRRSRFPKSFFDREQLQCQATLLRIISVTESFCAERLLNEVEPVVDPSRHKSVSAIWERAAIGATNSWSDQKLALRDWLGIRLETSDWRPVEQLVEARNAIAHGLGTLTRRQLRNQEAVRLALADAGIALNSHNEVVLTDQALKRSVESCRHLISAYDVALQTAAGGN